MGVFEIYLMTIGFFIFHFAVMCDAQRHGTRLLGQIIRIEPGISFNECMRLCDKVVDCLSINYYRKKHFCELNAQIDDGSLVEAPGYVYKEKVSSDSVCSRTKCLTGDICGTNDTCNITQCSYNLNIRNGIVHGNMFGIGAQRVIECLPNYKLVLGENMTICTDQGKWDYTWNIRCEQVCPIPVQIYGGIIVNSNMMTVFGPKVYNDTELISEVDFDILDSSTVTYQCDTYRRMLGSAVITCLSGSWSPYPRCKFTYNLYCSRDQDCLEPGLVCSGGTCQCNGWNVYSYTVRDCVERCPNGLANTFKKHSDVLGINFVVIQTLTTIAILCTMTVLILLLVLIGTSRTRKRTNKAHRAGVVIGALLSLLAGILSLVASGIFGGKLMEARDQSLKAGQENILLYPTALVLNGIGGVIAHSVFFILIVYFCCAVTKKDESRNQNIMLAPIKQDYCVYQIQNGGYITSVQPQTYHMYSLRCLANGPIATSSSYGDYRRKQKATQEQIKLTNGIHPNVQFAHHLPRRALDFVRISYHKRDNFALYSL